MDFLLCSYSLSDIVITLYKRPYFLLKHLKNCCLGLRSMTRKGCWTQRALKHSQEKWSSAHFAQWSMHVNLEALLLRAGSLLKRTGRSRCRRWFWTTAVLQSLLLHTDKTAISVALLTRDNWESRFYHSTSCMCMDVDKPLLLWKLRFLYFTWRRHHLESCMLMSKCLKCSFS